MPEKKLFVSIVTYNNAKYIKGCLDALLMQNNFSLGQNLIVSVIDNASSDNTVELVSAYRSKGILLICNRENMGFSGAHNQAVNRFLKSEAEYFLCLNPDLLLLPETLINLSESFQVDDRIGTASPKLLRADDKLEALRPAVIDACGMYMTPDLRHFDRGSGQPDGGQFEEMCFVFGGSGACLLMRREFVNDLILAGKYEEDTNSVYSQLSADRGERSQLFDEGFFAYREDAELAWRAQKYGWKCVYVPKAVGLHVRQVTPEKRNDLPPVINLLGVRNRFLLQLTHYHFSYGLIVFIRGYLIRNLLVILAVLIKERSSLGAFSDLIKLLRRTLDRRAIISKKQKIPTSSLRAWFSNRAYCEKLK